MTHDYLLILAGKADANGEQSSMSLVHLNQEALRTLRLAKNAVLYAISAVTIAERSRKGDRVRLTEAYQHTFGLPSAAHGDLP